MLHLFFFSQTNRLSDVIVFRVVLCMSVSVWVGGCRDEGSSVKTDLNMERGHDGGGGCCPKQHDAFAYCIPFFFFFFVL